MDNIIERIARHADIDTRRAMGVGPRKLPPHYFDFPYREDLAGYVTVRFSRDIRLIRYYNEGQFDSYIWVFGHLSAPRVYGMDCTGGISIHNWFGQQDSWHPDFNADGSFKRARATTRIDTVGTSWSPCPS